MGLTSFDVRTLTRYLARRVDLHVRWITTIRANVRDKVANVAASVANTFAPAQPAAVTVAA